MIKFFDISIKNNSFCIAEYDSKPKPTDLALETIKKIEHVVKNKYKYQTNKDLYSKWSQDQLFEHLLEKAIDIAKRYHKKVSKLNWLFRKIFSKEKEISTVITRIQSYIKPPPVFPRIRIDQDASRHLLRYLGVEDLKALAQVNHNGETEGKKEIVRRAKEFGYDGGNYNGAVRYINDLSKQVTDVAKQGLIPQEHFSHKKKILDLEKTLQNLKKLSTEDLFTILSNEKLYSSKFEKLRKIFTVKGNWKLTQNNNETINQKGSTALVLCTKNGDKNIVKLLLQHGASPSIPDSQGYFPLDRAALEGHADIVKLLLESPHKVNLRTALAYACGCGDRSRYRPNAKVVELLLKHGADPNISDSQGYFPLDWAAEAGHADIVKLLLESNAKADQRLNGHNTALAYACGCGDRRRYRPNAKVVELLLKHGADPNISDRQGYFPLDWAAEAGHADIVELLLKSKAKADQRLDGHNTALAYACGCGDRSRYSPNAKVVELLLKYGADPTIPDRQGYFPLDRAALEGHADIVKLLLKSQYKVNPNTALVYACGCGDESLYSPNPEVVELLLEHGANPRTRDKRGYLP